MKPAQVGIGGRLSSGLFGRCESITCRRPVRRVSLARQSTLRTIRNLTLRNITGRVTLQAGAILPVLVVGLAQIVFAQAGSSPARAQFEVASIKPSAQGVRGATFYNPTRERFQIDDVTVKGLIAYACNVREFQIEGASGWVASDRYNVIAKPDGELTDERIRAMVQSLLAERMGLKIHRESREMSVLSLTVAKGGPKLQESAIAAGPTMRGGEGRLTGQNLTMDMLASLLANRVERPVLNRTGMPGQFDIKLEWVPEESPETGPSIFTAVQEQLGLRLETERAAAEILVVEHVDRPSPN